MLEKNRLEKSVSPVKWRTWSYASSCKILLGDIPLKSTETLLYFFEEEMLKWGSLCERLWKWKLERNVVVYLFYLFFVLIAGKISRSLVIKFEVAESKLSLLIKNNVMHVEKYSRE